MDRRGALRTGAVAGAFALAGCLSGGGDDSTFEEGFEDGMDGWSTGAAIGPEVELSEFEWTVEVSDDQATTGDRSLRIWNEGDYDDGTTWVVHPVSISSGEAYEVTVTAQFWSESESFNRIRDVVMRLGPDPPEVEEDFPDPGVNTSALDVTPYGGLREPLWLADGWREYVFEWTTPTVQTDELHLAIGTSVIWETQAQHYVDDVLVEIEPR